MLDSGAAPARDRFDRVATALFPELLPTRSSARKAIRRGEVLLDGEPAEPSRWVDPGQTLTLLERTTGLAALYEHPVDVVYEDEHLAVVDKPPGLWTSGPRMRTVENALPHNLRPSGEPDALIRPLPAHRLDRQTGGLLLVSKTRRAQVRLGQLFQERAIHKRYRAICIGRLEGEGEVDEPVEGRDALTRWSSVSVDPAVRTGFTTTVDAWPVTGRTHQIRRHLASLGHPILGDALYGVEGAILRGKGLYLWSIAVELPHPVTAVSLSLEIPEPAKFDAFRQREARRVCRLNAAWGPS